LRDGDPRQRFKDAARRFASGVTVVTTRSGPRVHGITASSFSSLSLDPLLVAVAVEERSRLIELVEGARFFAISVLARGQHHLARHFATAGREQTIDGFAVVASYPVSTGAPILVGSIAHFDCRLHSILPGGDHRILIGEVVAAGESDGEPLLYFEGDYHELGDPSLTTEAGTSASGIDGADLLAVQRVVEPKIAALAARTATRHDLSRLRSLLQSAAAVVDQPRMFTELSLEFHVALAEASGNRGLRALAVSLRADQQFAYEARTDLARARHVVAAHEAILCSIEAGDAVVARAAMHEHILDMQHHFCPEASEPPQGGLTDIRRTSMPASTSGSTARPA
jgi:flavin reductase (DIM6/NTAB) family NADH-FMN oxidoreductase RutF